MRLKIFLIIFHATIVCSLIAQSLPDKIIINEFAGFSWNIQHYRLIIQPIDNKYGLFYLDSTQNLKFLKSISINQYQTLVNEIFKKGYDTLTISLFNIDSVWLKQNAENNLKYCKSDYKQWSAEQKDYVINELSKISNYNIALKRFVQLEGSFIIHQESSKVIEISLVYAKDTINLKSNSLGLGFRIPWTFQNDKRRSYNFGISKAIFEITNNKWIYKEPKFSKKEIVAQMVREIFEYKCRKELYELAPKQFSKELNELKSAFEIKKSIEYGARGRYTGSTPQVFRVSLNNQLMKQNVSLQYFITRQGKTLYPRDSLLKDYKELINRIQSVDFLMDFLSQDTSRKIEIYYFDNKGINDYIIDGFNKNSIEWANYEKYNTDSKFEHLYCGCNFRYDNKYLQKSILFELTDEYDNSSMWILLPDNIPVLHYFEGNRVYKYSYQDFGTTGISVQYACMKFDKFGNMIKRKK